MSSIDFSTLSFVRTRARTGDVSTSHAAAKHAATGYAAAQRIAIVGAVERFGPMTAREIAEGICMAYHDVQRRISECAGIERTGEVRDGCAVWRAIDKPN